MHRMSQTDLLNGVPTSVAGLSIEAKAFLDNGPVPFHGQYQAEGVELLRSRLRADSDLACRRALLRHDAVVRDVVMGGIRCMEVSIHPLSGEAIFFCFGGGMIAGSPFEDLVITAALARYANATVIVPYYRLAPEHPFPAATEDVLAAYRATATKYGVENTSVAGESAGGNLALVLVQSLPLMLRPRAMALMSPWCDLTHQGESVVKNAPFDPTISPDDVRRAAEAYCNALPKTDPRISPLFSSSFADIPPTMITTGSYDLLLSDSIRLAEKLRDNGVNTTLRIWEALWHAFEYYEGLPEADASIIEIATFLRREMS